jgi:gluconolactonase
MVLRSPQPATYDVVDERFRDLVVGDAQLRHLVDGCLWAEGPVYVPHADAVFFSDVRTNRQLRVDLATEEWKVSRNPSEYSNGHTVDHDGVVIVCEHGTRSVRRLLPDGNRPIVADRFEGKRFNSPNDVVVAADGCVWFTDPTYGIDSNAEGYFAVTEIGSSNVYRVDPATGEVTAEITNMVRPNGLAFSLDGRSLYVADTGASHVPDGPRHIRRFDVESSHVVGGTEPGVGDVFAICPVGAFDGFRIDADGRIWASGASGVHCYLADGTLLGTIRLPEPCANLEFGGADRRTLYMTATSSLYAIDVGVAGAPRPSAR